jgi:hypothetical protein
VVREHVHVIFSPFFDIDYDDLLYPKGELNKVVPLGEKAHIARWEICPQFPHVQPVRRVAINVLRALSQQDYCLILSVLWSAFYKVGCGDMVDRKKKEKKKKDSFERGT